MKLNKKYFLALAPALLMTSCADYFDTANYLVEQPESDARLAYLDEYKPMKEYVNRSAHPGFLLGTGVNAEEFIKGEGVYLLTKSNFDMITAGNAMKYASVVGDNGDMNFGTVRDFVSAAENAGLQVYGHTLCWHSQQNIKWLNSLLADKEIAGGGGDGATVWASLIGDADGSAECPNLIARVKGNADVPAPIVNDPERGPVYSCDILADPVDAWDCQFFIKSDKVLKEGDNVRISFMYKCTDARNIDTQAHGEPGNYHHWSCIGTLSSDSWKEHTKAFTVDSSMAGEDGFVSIAFNLSGAAAAGQFLIDDVVYEIESAAPATIQVPLMATADGSAENANLIARVKGNGDVPAPIVNDPTRGSVYKCDILSDPVDAWDCQFFIKSNEALQSGDKINLKFWYRTDDTRNIDTQAHGNPGEYHHWACIGTLASTPEWKEHTYSGTVGGEWVGDNGFISVAFNLSSAAAASTFYVDDVEFTVERSGNTMPLTSEEKAEILEDELDRWIKGSMDATAGKVKAWDVVNEPLQDTWGDIPLKSAAASGGDNNFYWQDYLGENYVRIAVKSAREHYAEQEGANPSDLKLFVNDYNLEAAYNNNDKAKSLVNWIKKWEADGETKIDGIGSQMHVSYSMNPETQKKNEDAVVNMMQILANSGKLIRITELDMGINDANGNEIKTADVTFEQHKLMGEYYRFIINKYFEIIPVDQQFGICQWAQTDSPDNSGWRAGCPIGLWNLNYQRKPAYGSVCDAYGEN